MIDAQFRAKFATAVTRARREGRDLAEVLDEAGLLATKLLMESAGERGLVELLEAFERRDPSMFMRLKHGRAHGSPEDMHAAVADFLRTHVDSRRVNIGHRGLGRG